MNSCVAAVAICVFVYLAVVCRISSASCSGAACFPPSRDLSTVDGVKISSNSTCGEEGVEDFCVKQDCDYKCDAKDPSRYHGVNLTIDKFDGDSYWKSKNFDENVVLQLDLGHSYFFTEIVVTFRFEYPAAMYLAKSDDYGKTWETLTYLSTDCIKYFNMSVVEEKNRDSFAVQCFGLNPQNGAAQLQASYSPWRDRQFNSLIVQNHSLQEEFLATNFRLVLVKFQTPSGFNPAAADKRSFYFAVKDWHVDGHCYCNGQSGECSQEESWKCSCTRNTTGDSCEMCLPLFNNEKYEKGKPCEKCKCHNHSLSCLFNETKGYGVCQNCSGHTTGDGCNECLPYYYDARLPLEHPEHCQACNCNPSGITSNPDSDLCNQTTGQCECKGNVTGLTCGECRDGYWSLSKANPYGCQECVCEPAATVNNSSVCDKQTGQCPCREHVTGLMCTECEDGYYGLEYSDPNICKDCGCSIVGSINITCDQTTGDCYCRGNFNGSNCTSLTHAYYVPGVLDMTYEAETGGPDDVYNVTSGVYGVLIDGYSATRSVVFDVKIPKNAVYKIVLRYQTAMDWKNVSLKVESPALLQPYSCDGLQSQTNGSFILTATILGHLDAVDFGDRCMAEGSYTLTLEFPLLRARSIGSRSVLIDSLVILPSIESFKYPVANNETLSYYRRAFSYQSWSRNRTEIDQTLAPYFSFLNDGAKACFCNETGSHNDTSCDPNGGQCACKPGVHGLSCDRCEPAFYKFTEAGCQACECDPLGSNSSLCDQETGRCQCKPGVEGPQCDRCKASHYGFQSGSGCSPCLCDPQYSTSPQCDENGACDCLPGVNGPKCERCNDTSFNLTSEGCDACYCNVHGSASLSCDQNSGNCTCKSLAVGQKCDSCPHGFYYGLSRYHPGGCLKCQCSGNDVRCVSKQNMYESSVRTDLEPFPAGGGIVFDLDGWDTTSGAATIGYGFIQGRLRGHVDATINTADLVYFTAPAKFLGDKRNAYQHSLSFYLKQSDTKNPFYFDEGDVIIKGKWFNESLVHKFNKRPGHNFSEFSVFFGESHWTVGDVNGRIASSYELVAALSELTQLYIRAKWSNNTGVTTSMGTVTMFLSREYLNQSAIPSGARRTKSVEKCDCPPEFAGDSCERCARGYTRKVPNSGPYEPCSQCRCNGHSDECDSETGVCLRCQHNTTGDDCGECAVGFYGNASLGSHQACRPCSCYGGHKSCNLVPDGSFVCNCTSGYEGHQCQTCADGYFGTPTEPGGRCTPCDCNSNSKTCNQTTGDCSSFCESNTTGFNCEWCKGGFYGNALTKTCEECNCTVLGSVNNVCDRTSGNCSCLQNVEGKTCSQCSENAWGYESGAGCIPCNCSADGATSPQCNLTTGACSCKQNVTGTKCDRCIDGLYDVSKGCIGCQCNMTYSNSSVCDSYSGQCSCKQSPEGGFYGGRQCTECRWDAVGTFPSCIQCNETCYANWYNLIDIERDKVFSLADKVTDVLQTFNGTSVQDINQTLSELNSKLKYSEEVFTSAQYSLKEKEEEYKKINETVTELREKLHSANESLTAVSSYLADTVAPFDGTVRTDSSVSTNYSTIRAWADQILQDIESANRSAHQSYQRIMTYYEKIRRYNKSGFEASEQVKKAVERLNEVENKTTEAKSILNSEFYDNVDKNKDILEQLTKDSEKIGRLVNESSELTRKANEMLKFSQTNLSEARDETTVNQEESAAVYNLTLQAQQKAYESLNTSRELKLNSTAVLNSVENALEETKNSLDNMTLARMNAKNATTISESVLAMSIPVDPKTIHDMSSEILGIEVNETVNATYQDATAGLKTAEKAQELSEKAMNISRLTLSQVKEIELKIEQADSYREEAVKLQNSTDQMVKEIVQVTDDVEREYSAATSVGQHTLQLLNTTIEEIDKSLKCFNESREVAMNANKVADLAYRQILNASKIHNNTETILRSIEASLNSSYVIVMESYRKIAETNQNATRLYEEVKEAENLLKSYIIQRDEMNALKTEVAQLEDQLDSLNKDLDKRLAEYESCGNN